MHQIVIVIAQYFIIIPVALFGYVFIRAKRPEKTHLLALAIVSLIITTLLAKLANHIHTDLRPFIRDGVTPYFKGSTDNGFPSDHTTYSALIACVVFTISKKWGIALFILATVIGSARVIAGVHHGQDIVGGLFIAMIGVVMSSGLIKIILKQRLRPKADTTNITKKL